MSKLDQRRRMASDRHLRNSARALLAADVDHLRNNLSTKSFAARALDRINEGATELYDEAVEMAEDNKGALAALVAAILVWFARNPILEMLGLRDEEAEDYDEEAER